MRTRPLSDSSGLTSAAIFSVDANITVTWPQTKKQSSQHVLHKHITLGVPADFGSK